MTLTLFFHPFASFCQKVLITLYEAEIAFDPHLVDLGNPEERAELASIWPLARFPVLRDAHRGATIPGSSSIIEYLARHHPGAARLIPADADAALRARHWDRIFDDYVEVPMQKIVTDRLRPADGHDDFGVRDARATLETTYGVIDRAIDGQTWAAGDTFTLADCAAAPALFYADWVQPIAEHGALSAYFARLMRRPSFARVVEEAKPYRGLFPR